MLASVGIVGGGLHKESGFYDYLHVISPLLEGECFTRTSTVNVHLKLLRLAFTATCTRSACSGDYGTSFNKVRLPWLVGVPVRYIQLKFIKITAANLKKKKMTIDKNIEILRFFKFN